MICIEYKETSVLLDRFYYSQDFTCLVPFLLIQSFSYLLAGDAPWTPSNEIVGSGRHMHAISTPFL